MNGLEKLKKNQEDYSKMVSELEYLLDNKEILIEDFNKINSYFDDFENVLFKVKDKTQKLIKKILIKNLKENKNNDQESLEYNRALLYSGKPAKAIQEITRIAKEGNPEAQYILGKTYLNGIIGNFNDKMFHDEGIAYKWLKASYNNGNKDAGYLLAIAEQKVLNIEKAIKIYSKLAEENHLRSLNELLIIYKNHPLYKNEQKYFSILEKVNTNSNKLKYN